MGINKFLLFLHLVVVLLLVSCTKPIRTLSIQVRNETNVDREHELVELDANSIATRLLLSPSSQLTLQTTLGVPVPYQFTHNGKIVFPAAVKAHSNVRYILGVIATKKRAIEKPLAPLIQRLLRDSTLRQPTPWIAYTLLDKGPLRYTVKTGYVSPSPLPTQLIEIRTTQFDVGSDGPHTSTHYTCAPPCRATPHLAHPLKVVWLE
ncbi:MAG: DUF4861 family protein [Bacteroidaceae bacterium]